MVHLNWKNEQVNENYIQTSRDVAIFIQKFISELEGTKVTDGTKESMHKVWEPPPAGVYKANFDAAFDEALSRFDSRVVFCDSKGLVLASKLILHSKVQSAFAAEALACTEAIEICLDLEMEADIIEVDSLVGIKKCKSTSPDRPKISPYT